MNSVLSKRLQEFVKTKSGNLIELLNYFSEISLKLSTSDMLKLKSKLGKTFYSRYSEAIPDFYKFCSGLKVRWLRNKQ